jgi:hypothetical protein
MNEVRQVLTAHAGQTLVDEQNILHITLAGALDPDLDAPQRFNELPVAARTRIARQALARAGAVNVLEAPGSLNLVEGPPAPGRAMDAALREDCRLSAEDAAFLKGILRRLKARKRRRGDHDSQVAADSPAQWVEATQRDGERVLGRAGDSGVSSDLDYYQRAARACCGG